MSCHHDNLDARYDRLVTHLKGKQVQKVVLISTVHIKTFAEDITVLIPCQMVGMAVKHLNIHFPSNLKGA